MRELRGALAALYRCTDEQILLEGRAGTAKTTGVCTFLLDTAQRYPGSRQLIVRETRSSLTESVLVTLERLLGPTHPEVLRCDRKNRESYHLWDSTIVTGGLDRPDKLFSTEWDTVYIAEATDTTQNAFELFARAMRNGKTPVPKRIADCNPGPRGHWLNQLASPASDTLRRIVTRADYHRLQLYNHGPQSKAMRRLISVHQDNPGYWDMENWRFHLAGANFIRSLESMSGHRRARMLDGRWVAASGTVYPEFDEARHVITPFKIPPEWPIYVGVDPGYDHPCAILWFAVGENGCVYIIDELYRGGVGVDAHAADIKARNAGRTVRGYFADPQHAFSKTAQSPKTIAEQFLACGLTFEPWPRTAGNEESMVEDVRTRFKQDKLKVFAPCTNTIGEFLAWSYKRTIKGEIPNGNDEFEDKNNHAMDVVKGMNATGLPFKASSYAIG